MSLHAIPKRRLRLVYDRAAQIINAGTPYVYGGGHGPGFAPTLGILTANPHRLLGYDCSGFASACEHAGGCFGVGHPSEVPLDTEEFEKWGEAGEGAHITLWVRNDSVQQHCFLDFHGLDEWEHRYAQAPHTGAFVEWFTPSSFGGFSPRHFPGT